MKVQVVTDNTSDIPQNVADEMFRSVCFLDHSSPFLLVRFSNNIAGTVFGGQTMPSPYYSVKG